MRFISLWTKFGMQFDTEELFKQLFAQVVQIGGAGSVLAAFGWTWMLW